MIVEVLTYYGDFCGNCDYHHYGFFEAESVEAVRKVFPKGFVCGWEVREVGINNLPSKAPPFPKEPR